MVSRRARARFFNRATPHGFSRLTLRKRKVPPLRYVVLILLTLGGLSGWSFWGGRLMASINPDLRMQFHLFKPALDAWITPPEYTGLPPIMIVTPAGSRYADKVIDVPEGSILTAHLGDSDGGAPALVVNGEETAFEPDENGGFEVAKPIRSGDTISIRRGWKDLGSWHINVMADAVPKVAFTEPPSITDHKAVQLSYEATDDYGVSSVIVRITPRASLPRADSTPVEIPLASPNAKELRRISFEDLTAYPWAGSPVQIQLIATNAAGRTAQSASVDLTVPARIFTNPIARALIEERVRLLKNPDDENTRDEVANVMAGVAHVPGTFHNDSIVLMTLRSGAVRLVLNHGPDVAASVNSLLWQSAVRIEDGTAGVAERRLRDVQSELADALDRKAPAAEVQNLIDRLREAMGAYMAVLSARPVPAAISGTLSKVSGVQTNMLAPKDVEKMLQNIHDLSASGASDAARDELLKLNQKLEGLRDHTPSFAEEMQRRAHNLNYPEGVHDSAEHTIPNF